MASIEKPPAAHGDAPFSILIDGPGCAFGLRSRPISSAMRTIFGGRAFHLQNPMDAYSSGSPLDSA